jgi:hypothetical protein
VREPADNAKPTHEDLKREAERIAASQELHRSDELFRGQPPKFLGPSEARPAPPPILPVVPSKPSVWPLLIFPLLIVVLIVGIFLMAFYFGATPG